VDELNRLLNGFRVSQSLHALATLRIPEALADGPRSVADVATEVRADEPSLYRLLRAVATVGVLEELPERHFRLTEMGFRLRDDVPGSLAGWARFIGRPYYWNSWSRLTDALRSGGHAFRMENGTDVWTYRREHPEESAIFNAAMRARSEQVAAAVATAHDFSRYNLLVDVGGGSGSQLAAILQRYPALRGILFDQPHIVADSRQYLDSAAISARCELVGGSFFESVPAGADVYMLQAILHDWYDEDSHRILSVCHEAMDADARLLVVDAILPPPNEGYEGKFSDINMFVAAGGLERTEDEWRTLLRGAGFEILNAAPAGPVDVIEARRLST
jgi:hypothetical protein